MIIDAIVLREAILTWTTHVQKETCGPECTGCVVRKAFVAVTETITPVLNNMTMNLIEEISSNAQSPNDIRTEVAQIFLSGFILAVEYYERRPNTPVV